MSCKFYQDISNPTPTYLTSHKEASTYTPATPNPRTNHAHVIPTATHLALCLNAVSRVQVQFPLSRCVCVDLRHELFQLDLLPGLELVGQREMELTTVGLQWDP